MGHLNVDKFKLVILRKTKAAVRNKNYEFFYKNVIKSKFLLTTYNALKNSWKTLFNHQQIQDGRHKNTKVDPINAKR